MAWQVYALSGSALNLGLLGLARFLPTLAVFPLAGFAADSYSRRNLIIASNASSCAMVTVMATITASHLDRVEFVYGLAIVLGLVSTFERSAREALLPEIVPSTTYLNAATVSNTFQKLGTASGPVVAGLTIAVGGVLSGYVAFAVVAILALLPLFAIGYKPPAIASRRLSLDSITQGLSFVGAHQVILGAMLLDMIAVIFGGVVALLPIYAADILRVGPAGYGILYAARDVGAVGASVVLLLRPPVRRTGRALVHTVAAYGAATIAFGLSQAFVVSVLLYLVVGAADQVSVVMRRTTIQMATPNRLRGRIAAVSTVFVGGSSQLGAIESGVVAAVSSAVVAVTTGGAAALVTAIGVRRWMPNLYTYEVDVDLARPALAAPPKT